MKSEKNKKIICLVSNDLSTDNRMHKICNSLAKNNFNVELLGRCLHNSKPLPTLYFLPTRIQLLFNKNFFFYAELNIRFFIYLMLHQFDIVCACDIDTLPAAWLAAKLKRKKVVLDAHEYFSESPELIGRNFVQKFWQSLEQFLVPKVDVVYTVNNSLAKIFKDNFNKDCKVIRSLPLKNNSLEKAKTEKYFLYQGAVNIGRGIKESILAIQHIEDYKLYIVGDGDEINEIKNIIKHYKLENKVFCLGKLLPHELKQITQKAFVGINLLEHRGKNYYYSLNNKFFDYIQAYIPQIIIAFPEYIQYNNQYEVGILVEKLIIQDIVSAMKKLIDDENYYQKIKRNCMVAAQDLNWENEEQKLIDIYKSL